MLGWTARAAVVLVSSAGSRCSLVGQLLGWPRPHSRSHTALRVKCASGARGNDSQAPLRLFTHRGRWSSFASETTLEGKGTERRGEKSVCGLYTAWILNKERPSLVLEVTPLHDEQVTDRAFVIVYVLWAAGTERHGVEARTGAVIWVYGYSFYLRLEYSLLSVYGRCTCHRTVARAWFLFAKCLKKCLEM